MFYLRRYSSGISILSGIFTVLSAWIYQAHGSDIARRMLIGGAVVFGIALTVRIGIAITRPLWGGGDPEI